MGLLGEESVPLGCKSRTDIQRLKVVLREKETSQLFEKVGPRPTFNYIAVIEYSDKMTFRGERVHFSSLPGCHTL